MRRRLWFILPLFALVGTLALTQTAKTPCVVISGGHELRLLKASFGTTHYLNEERGWKRFATELFSQGQLASLGMNRKEIQNSHGSMVVWLTEFDPAGSKFLLPAFSKPVALFADGNAAAGRASRWGTNIFRVEFPIYPRHEALIKIRVEDDGRQIEFNIKNPEPAVLADWTAPALPHTNYTRKMAAILDTNGPGSRLGLRGLGSADVDWQAEIFDRAGNWEQFEPQRELPVLRNRALAPGPLKLSASAIEYISAGKVSKPSPNSIVPLKIEARARALGVEAGFLLGRGEYRIESGRPVPLERPLYAGALEVSIMSESNWVVSYAPSSPCLLLIYTNRPAGPEFRARLRERPAADREEGSIFQNPIFITRRFLEADRELRVFTMPFRLPALDLEAEIVAHHQATEFIFDPTAL